MRRLTILLATVGALLLVPATGAFANGTMKVVIEGAGTGTVDSTTGSVGTGAFKGTPPIECTYKAPGPATGVCENELGREGEEGEEFESTGLRAVAAPGSEFVGWVVEVGGLFSIGCGGGGPSLKAYCTPLAFGGEEPDMEVYAFFEAEPGVPLTVTKEGTGKGTVVSNPAGIECGFSCSKSFEENTKVTLTASPETGDTAINPSTFVSWKGCDKGGVNGRQCTVTMDKAKSVSAKFTRTYDVFVSREGSGLGKVSSSPGGVLCLSNCYGTTAAFKEGTSVTLSAAPSKNYVFTEWTGACSGSGSCSLTMTEDKDVGAVFTPVAQHKLRIDKTGGGNGTVKSNLAGINCGATCFSMGALYFQGQEVELTAIPGKGSTFAGWTGCNSQPEGKCKVAISEEKVVKAEFN